MTDSDTRADFALAAATPPPAEEDEGVSDGVARRGGDAAGQTANPPAAASASRGGSGAPANCWRGLFSLSLGLTLCALAVAESTGAANAPAWFLGFAIPVLTEWVGEWVVWGRKKNA